MNFKGFIKKQGIGFYVSLASVILAIIGLILFASALSSGMNLTIASGSQPFYEKNRDEDAVMMVAVTTFGILALVAMIGSMILAQFEDKEGVVGKVCGISSDVLRFVAPVFLMMAAIYFVYGSFTGLGWTFFSNEELEIFPAAISTGKTVITGAVFLLVSSITGIVGAFFKDCKAIDVNQD